MAWDRLYCLIIISKIMCGKDLLILLPLVGSVSSQQPADQGAITGLSTSIPCELGRQVPAPFWFINGTVYELFSIPQYFPSIPEVNSYTSLSIPFVTFMIDNVVFRCATFERNGNLSPNNNAFRLVVQGDNLEVPEHNITALVLDYQRLLVQIDEIRIAWSFNNICSEEFELQGFVISNGQAVRVPAHNIQVGSSSTAQISTNQLNDNSSDIIYRLVAVWQNGTICSDRTSQDTYYSFEESAVLQTMVSTPRSPNTCFEVPSTETCGASLYFIWPQREEGLSCLCPVYDSDDGRSVFAACVRGCTNTDILPRLGEGEVCIPNLNASMSGSLVHFMCSTDPCTGNCFVKTILSSYNLVHSEEELPLVGFYTQTSILCDIETGLGFPHWFLNDTLYTLSSLLQLYPLFSVGANNSLMIVVIPEIDNTVFQCTAPDGNAVIFGTPTRIIINPNLEGNDLIELDDIAICFDYQDLEITNSSVRIGWTVDTQDDCDFIQVQRISSRTVTSPNVVIDVVVVETNSTFAHIDFNNLLKVSYFRIVAVSDNGSICSDATSVNTLYSFNGSQQLNTTYREPNSMVCFDIPSLPEDCSDIVVTWDKLCMCVIRYIQNCGCDSSDVGLPTLSENSKAVCFTDQNYSLNGTLSHFLYTCLPPNCIECENIRITTILSSHKVVISEPPTEPHIEYNSSSLCFSTRSSIQVEIEYTISATGLSPIVRQLPKSQCIDDPFPHECRNFSVIVRARNAVGGVKMRQTSLQMHVVSAIPFSTIATTCCIPPSKPSISYSNGLLCFEVDSITSVTLNYTISTTEEPDTFVLTLQSPQCVDDPFPNDCREFSVSVFAMNSAGSNQDVESFTSDACQEQNGNFTVKIIIIITSLIVTVVIVAIVLLVCSSIIILLRRRAQKSADELGMEKTSSRTTGAESRDDKAPSNSKVQHQETVAI